MIKLIVVGVVCFLAGALVFKNNPVKSDVALKAGEFYGNSLWHKFLGLFGK